MATELFSLLLLLLAAAFDVRGENRTALQALSDCSDLCRNTFPQHTYDQSSHVTSCQRGCRLYALTGYSKRGPQDLSSAKLECQSSCKEAYGDTGNYSACLIGCSGEESSAKERQLQFDDYERTEEQLAMKYLSLTAFVNSVMLPMMSSFDMLIPGSAAVEQEVAAVDYSDDGIGVIVVISSGKAYDVMLSSGIAETAQAEQSDAREAAVGVDASSSCSWSSFLDTSNWDVGSADLRGWSQFVLSALLMLSIIGMLWICCSTVATSAKYSPKRKLKLKELEHLQELQMQLLTYQQPCVMVDAMELPKKTAI